MQDYACFQIELSSAYTTSDWRDDIKNSMMKAGVQNQCIVFLFSDTQVDYDISLSIVGRIYKISILFDLSLREFCFVENIENIIEIHTIRRNTRILRIIDAIELEEQNFQVCSKNRNNFQGIRTIQR